VRGLPVVEVATDALRSGFSPRLAGCSQENVERLAEVDWAALPPILVLRPTNQVIDGMHRLLAARQSGRSTIAVRYVDGDEESAFVLAVSANVVHGLPLSLNDRKAAAARIVSRHADWSNRRIAAVTGLSDKTIASIRAWAAPEWAAEGGTRIGLDGKARPVAAAARRGVAAGGVLVAERDGAVGTGPDAGGHARSAAVDVEQGVRVLLRDPALRSTDLGRLLLRILSTLPVVTQNLERLVGCVPEHDLALLESLALANAEVWQQLAGQLAARGRANVDRRAELFAAA
jgi:hypothetical protein